MKLGITLFTTFICTMILVFVPPFSTTVPAPVLPVIICLIIAYLVACIFIAIFDIAADTMLFSFLVDKEHNSENAEGQMFAPQKLRELVAECREEGEVAAQKRKDSKAKRKGEKSQPKDEQ